MHVWYLFYADSRKVQFAWHTLVGGGADSKLPVPITPPCDQLIEEGGREGGREGGGEGGGEGGREGGGGRGGHYRGVHTHPSIQQGCSTM